MPGSALTHGMGHLALDAQPPWRPELMVGQAVSGHFWSPVDFPWAFGGHFDSGEPLPEW